MGNSEPHWRQRTGSGRAVFSAIEQLPEAELNAVAGEIRARLRERSLLIQGTETDQQNIIPVALTPWVLRRSTARYLQGLFRAIRRTVNRILPRYFEDPNLQQILPLREAELKWLKDSYSDKIPRPQTVFERFDTNLGPNVEEDLSSFQIIEFNAVGVGCVYLMPAATELVNAHLIPSLKEKIPHVDLVPPADYRQLLLGELAAHSKALGRPDCRVGLVERRETITGGCDEFSQLQRFFEEKGFRSLVGDPRELETKGETFLLKGQEIDIVYRDFQLEEVVSIKTHGGSVEGIEAAFAQNRVVSTVFGEFDHKSLCEIFTSPAFASYFTPQELRASKRRVPWTRLIFERKTTDPQGNEIDLIPYVREKREALVLKPNRGYGGEKVVVGEEVSEAEWSKVLEEAFSRPGSFVAQEKVKIEKVPMMVLKQSGRVQVEQHYVTLSVTATSKGVAFVGRCSPEPIVNISQGGGLVPVFLSV
ncbi:MAG: circularly permuted type 2 ATP-grasp protein [Candidatus Omnitrophica bacterium]|nr:circularly permuted type 2 ATP-grasp protein [Candidatus Omnitrophota bacterium]